MRSFVPEVLLLSTLLLSSCGGVSKVTAGPMESNIPVLMGPIQRIGGDRSEPLLWLPVKTINLQVSSDESTLALGDFGNYSFPSRSSGLSEQFAKRSGQADSGRVQEAWVSWRFLLLFVLGIEESDVSLRVSIR